MLGDSTFQIVAGGGQARATSKQLARSVVQLGVSPTGTINGLVQVGDMSALQGPTALILGKLAEAVAMRHRSGQTSYAVPVSASNAGALGDVTQVGTGTGTITPSAAPHVPVAVKIILGGALGTMTFQVSINGGAYGPTITSDAEAPTYSALNGFCVLTFPAGAYVADDVYSVGTDGVVTHTGTGTPVVTQASSPLDDFEVLLIVQLGGALGTAIVQPSLDNGRSSMPPMFVPSGGVVVIPGTGLVLTVAGTLKTGDTYSFLAAAPAPSTSDVNAALTALKNLRNVQFILVHETDLPSSTAGAYSQAATIDTAMMDALSDDLDWQAACECPLAGGGLGAGDIVVSGGAAVRDTADTDSVVIAGRGADVNRTAVFSGTYPQTSKLTGRHQLRPFGWFVVSRYVDTDPRQDLSAVGDGALEIYVPPGALSIGRDESVTPGLDNVQINTARTYHGKNGVFLSITAGGDGWKNMTTQASYQDAGALRALNVGIAQVRAVALNLLGQRPQVNADGTIAEGPRQTWSGMLDGAFKRALGMKKGGDFAQPQASLATATVLATSQLGQSPKQLDIAYSFQPLGFVSNVNSTAYFSGVISVTR